ncbi:MAG: hypothetical protein AAB214_11820, partial [Fibrobacterota bacterium]
HHHSSSAKASQIEQQPFGRGWRKDANPVAGADSSLPQACGKSCNPHQRIGSRKGNDTIVLSPQEERSVGIELDGMEKKLGQAPS